MKNVILFFTWVALILSVIFHLKIEGTIFVVISFIILAPPVIFVAKDIRYYLVDMRNFYYTSDLGIALYGLLPAVVSLLFYFFSPEYSVSFSLFFWVIMLASIKSSRSGIITKIITKEFRNVFLALSPFHSLW
ncbi:hypothetical protein CVU82_04035 [Candidatus Falkowbacteria bacterium HGW-Falkowbacteria-1]|jgi:hypothetical protein|uniref:Uncharacterized protein n=1 Tax=Candidatus Falkowbacteria bacterium HGW-Falkowbacteria-1 TaxID=2013768 RepID=A0A2N2E947_9BACT|nr:MAG: hypothetical protein CVU82_04035 [Candidatus Falkowbacteria bacterium HGW-Falkowbacteria-1]